MNATSGMIQRVPFEHPAIAGDVARLQKLLEDAFTALKFHRAGDLTLLNLACGSADETGALAAAVAPARVAYYLGIDIRANVLDQAARRWSLDDGTIEFRRGDASMTDRMKQLPRFDLIFIRHQNYWFAPEPWDRLLGNALLLLAPGGLLACTSYFDKEHELLKASLRTRGAELLWDARHTDSRPLHDAPGKSVDRRLAVFKVGSDLSPILG